MTTRGALKVVAGLVVLGALAYCASNYLTAESRVRTLCRSIPAGAKLDALTEFASLHGLSAPTGRSDTEYLMESRTFGRYGCEVHLKDGVVQGAEYSYVD